MLVKLINLLTHYFNYHSKLPHLVQKQHCLETEITLPSATHNMTSWSADFGKCQRDSCSPRPIIILVGSTGARYARLH